MTKKSVGKGRPANARLDTESIKQKIEFEILKANRNAANNLEKYFKTLDQYALGEKGSDTNIISSAKYMIEMATQYLEEEEEGENGDKPAMPDEDEDDEELISLEPNISLLRAK